LAVVLLQRSTAKLRPNSANVSVPLDSALHENATNWRPNPAPGSPNNLISCDFFQDGVIKAQAKPLAISCKLIGEH